MTTFKSQVLRELTEQQTRFAPAARRQSQIANAQKLLGEIDGGKTYPYEYVCYRLTEFRSEAYPALLLPGGSLESKMSSLPMS